LRLLDDFLLCAGAYKIGDALPALSSAWWEPDNSLCQVGNFFGCPAAIEYDLFLLYFLHFFLLFLTRRVVGSNALVHYLVHDFVERIFNFLRSCRFDTAKLFD